MYADTWGKIADYFGGFYKILEKLYSEEKAIELVENEAIAQNKRAEFRALKEGFLDLFNFSKKF